MSAFERALLELVEAGSWEALGPADRAAFRLFLEDAREQDLFVLLHEARRRWRRPRLSSSQTLAAQHELAAPPGEDE